MNPAGNGAPEAAASKAAERLGAAMARRATLLRVALALLAVAVIGAIGIGQSVAVVEEVRGSGSAINAAGNLRRLAHRAGGFAVEPAAGEAVTPPRLQAAVAEFEAALGHPALLRVRARDPGGEFSSGFDTVRAVWGARVKPRLLGDAGDRRALLEDVDAFAGQIDVLVAVLERDTEARIETLRGTLAVALAALLAVIGWALFLIRRRVFVPLTELHECATRIAAGQFDARTTRTGEDELGRVGAAFNTMAEELAAAYRELEQRVERKTADLSRSNRTLELLYHVIARLHHAPTSIDTYLETMKDLEAVLGLEGSLLCELPKHGGAANVLASSGAGCPHRDAGGGQCAACPARGAGRGEADEAGAVSVPIRDADRLYGVMRLELPPGRRLVGSQRALVDAVASHMAISLGLSHQSERERLLALQEERSVIARELHDSLAQSLSYMKIQASLLAPAVQDAARRDEALGILSDLREGISAAYRQLRELLSTFRLGIHGDFAHLLGATIEEYAGRSGLPIELDLELGRCRLNPNQEVHVLHIIREALSNATRHAAASRISVSLSAGSDGEVEVVVEDDGRGLRMATAPEPHHYGLTIMGERARGLGGTLALEPRAAGGTRVRVRFRAELERRPGSSAERPAT